MSRTVSPRPSSSRTPLRVCHVAYTFYENDNRVIRYAEALAERGDVVDVIALRRPGQALSAVVGGVRVLRIQRRAVSERSAWAYLLKIVGFSVQAFTLLSVLQLRRRYDLVHVHNVPDFLVFTALLPKLLGARVVLDIHDILPELYAGKFASSRGSATFRALLFVERLSCRFADHVIVANHLWHAKLITRTVDASRCTAILNYPDLRLFRPAPAAADVSSRRPFVMIYPGTLNRHQGVDLAVRAFARVKDRMPDAEFHIYGEGPMRADLLRLTHDLAVADRVKIFDRLPLAEIAGVMARADLGVVPKRGDGFGNEAFSTKTFELMACGVPLIVSRTAVDAHYFDESVVKFFTPGDESDLAAALVDAYADGPSRARRASAGRELATRYSWQQRAGDYENLVEALLPGALRPVPTSH